MHRYRKVYEEALFGGTFPVGWECIDCGHFVSQHKITPAGLDGTIVGGAILRGPHGCKSFTSSGETYSKQVIDENGKLTVIP